jgi:hypothetical protein
MTLDAPAEEHEALVNVGDESLVRRQRKPIVDKTSGISSRRASAGASGA